MTNIPYIENSRLAESFPTFSNNNGRVIEPIQGYFWAIHSDLSRRLVTPKGSLARESDPKWLKHSD